MGKWSYWFMWGVIAHTTKLSMKLGHKLLTHLPLVPHIRVSESSQHRFRSWFVACSAPSHYLNQCWLIANRNPVNKFQWNSYQNSIIFYQENAFEIVVCPSGGRFVQGKLLNYIPLFYMDIITYYNMTVWILARNDINFSMAAGLIRLHMPGVK